MYKEQKQVTFNQWLTLNPQADAGTVLRGDDWGQVITLRDGKLSPNKLMLLGNHILHSAHVIHLVTVNDH